MPNLIDASSNTARATRKWTVYTRPYVNLAVLTLAAWSPSTSGPLLAAALWLAGAIYALAVSGQSAGLTARSIAPATRAQRSVRLWLVACLAFLFGLLVAWLVIRWRDRRRAARAA